MDYLKCIGKYDKLSIKDSEFNYDNAPFESTLSVAEDSEEYIPNSFNYYHDKKHDKIFKSLFHNKTEMSNFLFHFLGLHISPQNLELQNPDFITKNYKYNQADILYKLKDRDIYFLIEQQTHIDYSMPYRILNYCVETIRLAVENKYINNKYYKFPKVIPIVLYIGDVKWSGSTSFADCEVDFPELNFNSLETKFKLIDINNYEITTLLALKTMIATTMILEKSKNNNDVIENLNKIVNNISNKDIKELKRIISFLYSDMKNINDIVNSINETEVTKNMSTVAERLREEYKNERLIGISQGISQIIKNMLKAGMLESDIIYYTKIDKKLFNKIKEEIENETQNLV